MTAARRTTSATRAEEVAMPGSTACPSRQTPRPRLPGRHGEGKCKRD